MRDGEGVGVRGIRVPMKSGIRGCSMCSVSFMSPQGGARPHCTGVRRALREQHGGAGCWHPQGRLSDGACVAEGAGQAEGRVVRDETEVPRTVMLSYVLISAAAELVLMHRVLYRSLLV